VANCESNGTAIGSYSANIATKPVTGLTSSTIYYFNVVVRDQAGNKASYSPLTQATYDISIDNTPEITGILGQTGYSHIFQATGGSGWYYWYLNNISPAISGLSIDLWSGILSGTIDACEGDYTVEVKVEDRFDSSITDTHQFTLTISRDTLNVSPAPSGGGESNPDFTVNSSIYSQNLSISGYHSGDFTWTINWTGADPGGFQLVKTSATEARLEKVDPTTEGSFTFTLNITDDSCPGNTIVTPSYTMTITGAGIPGPVPEGMEARWNFDGCDTWSGTGFDVVESFGNTEFNGMASGGVGQTGAGRFCRAAVFDGGDDKIVSRVFSSDAIVFTDEVTLSCWFKSPGGGNGSPRLIEFSDALGNYRSSTGIGYDRDGSLRAWVTSEAGVRGGAVDFSGTRYTDNKWHHVVYTYGSGLGTLYIDSVVKTSATNNATTDIHDAETFVMSGYYPNTSHGYKGMIDEVMIYSKALSQTEVAVMKIQQPWWVNGAWMKTAGMVQMMKSLIQALDRTMELLQQRQREQSLGKQTQPRVNQTCVVQVFLTE